MNLGKMKKLCNNMAVAGLIACLSVGITLYVMDPPASVLYKNIISLHQRLVSKSSGGGAADLTQTLAFYKLALQWPPSVCASTINCLGNITPEFTIHGLWPQNSSDKGILPYNKDKSCTNLTPVPVNLLMSEIQSKKCILTRIWPDLKNTNSAQLNQKFWEYEWGKHGMCSDYPDKPLHYFNAAIALRNHFVAVFKLQPGSTYKVQDVVEKVKAAVNGKPEIACGLRRGTTTNKVLAEVRLCYKKGNPNPQGIQDCKLSYSGKCNSVYDNVTFI